MKKQLSINAHPTFVLLIRRIKIYLFSRQELNDKVQLSFLCNMHSHIVAKDQHINLAMMILHTQSTIRPTKILWDSIILHNVD